MTKTVISTVLGIETSCDETSVAIVALENDILRVKSNIIASQAKLHELTGGVVPEVAAREHVEFIVPCIKQALEESQIIWNDVDGIAVTVGPGLIGSLLTGVNAARVLAYTYAKPLVGVNHIEGHMYGNWLDRADDVEFPVVVLTASGGHNELILIRGHGDYELIGETQDDAAGEAFDKVARVLGLGYPGGPAIAKAALDGDSHAVHFPRAWLQEVGPQQEHPKKITNFNFSFLGLKTAVLQQTKSATAVSVPDMAASFQEAVVDVLASKAVAAAEEHGARELHLAGGVSANTALRERVQSLCPSGVRFRHPEKISYCTDNAAMIAGAGFFRLRAGERHEWKELEADPTLPLTLTA